jgi:hypothetical protein
MTSPLDRDSADAVRAGILAELDRLADLGDCQARHAAAILRGARSAGRPKIDDTAAMARIADLSAAGKRREAVAIVARSIASGAKAVAAAERRLRMRRRNSNGKN